MKFDAARTLVSASGIQITDERGQPLTLGTAYRNALLSWSPTGIGAAMTALRASELAQRITAATVELTDGETLLLEQCIDTNPCRWPSQVLASVWRHVKGLDTAVSSRVTTE